MKTLALLTLVFAITGCAVTPKYPIRAEFLSVQRDGESKELISRKVYSDDLLSVEVFLVPDPSARSRTIRFSDVFPDSTISEDLPLFGIYKDRGGKNPIFAVLSAYRPTICVRSSDGMSADIVNLVIGNKAILRSKYVDADDLGLIMDTIKVPPSYRLCIDSAELVLLPDWERTVRETRVSDTRKLRFDFATTRNLGYSSIYLEVLKNKKLYEYLINFEMK